MRPARRRDGSNTSTPSSAAHDWVVVGCGLTGATFARCIAERSAARVLVVDQRSHIGGNVFDSLDDSGVRVQRYGAHIFHTGSDDIWNFLSRFTDWFPYQHRVLASVNDQLVPIPFNFTSLERLLPAEAADMKRDLLIEFPGQQRVPVARLVGSPTRSVRELGEFVLETVFRHYTAKQWGQPIEKVDPAVLSRVPVTLSHDDRYFRDKYQAIPSRGYTALVERLLDHPGIDVALETDGAGALRQTHGVRALWTGRIDAFFEYEFGALPYRSLRFENVHRRSADGLPVAVVNHPSADVAFTRVIDHRHFAPTNTAATTLTYEYPTPYQAGHNEPFYPVSDPSSMAMFDSYAALARDTDVLFAGRLGDFRYYDMHQAVGRAMTLAGVALEGRCDPHQLATTSR